MLISLLSFLRQATDIESLEIGFATIRRMNVFRKIRDVVSLRL